MLRAVHGILLLYDRITISAKEAFSQRRQCKDSHTFVNGKTLRIEGFGSQQPEACLGLDPESGLGWSATGTKMLSFLAEYNSVPKVLQ